MTTVSAFFEQLGQVGYNPQLQEIRGTIRLEIHDDEQSDNWFLAIDDGRVRVEHRWQEADAVIRVEQDVAAEMTLGNVNALAALMRGDVFVEGNVDLALKMGRLFPPSPLARGPHRRARRKAGR